MLTYALTDSFVIDAAYAHISVSEEKVDVTRPGAGAVSTRIQAETGGSVDIVPLALRRRFRPRLFKDGRRAELLRLFHFRSDRGSI